MISGVAGTYSASTLIQPWALSSSFSNVQCGNVDIPQPPPSAGGPAPLTVPIGNKHLVVIDLGVGTPLNGSLTVDTCTNPLFDTVLFVSGGPTGCPSSPVSWICTDSDDDSCGVTSVSVCPIVLMLSRRVL